MLMKYIKLIIRDCLSILAIRWIIFQKLHFLVKIASGNQSGGAPWLKQKFQNLLKTVNRMFRKYVKVIIMDYL